MQRKLITNETPYKDIKKESDLPLNAYFITDVDTESTYLHVKYVDHRKGEYVYHMQPTEVGAVITNHQQAKYFIDKTEQNNKLKPVLCSEVFKKNKSNERKTNS